MRIALVNDMPLAVEALRRVVGSVPGYQVAWIATDGEAAVQQCAADVPDLLRALSLGNPALAEVIDLAVDLPDQVDEDPG